MILINGTPQDCLPVTDRGLQYGDGVFETIALQQQNLLCWPAHYRRLVRGCQRLGIAVPDEGLLRREITQLSVTAERSVLKLIVTRGQGGRGYRAPVPAPPASRILASYAWPDYAPDNATAGVRVRICNTVLGRNPVLAGIKHLNRLEQVLARSEWQDADIAEGLMFDTDGRVIAGTMSNLFLVRGGEIWTPALTHCGIDGIVRQAVLDHAAALSLPCHVTALGESDLQAADALFLTNSLFGIWPVRQLADRQFSDHSIARQFRQALVTDKVILP